MLNVYFSLQTEQKNTGSATFTFELLQPLYPIKSPAYLNHPGLATPPGGTAISTIEIAITYLKLALIPVLPLSRLSSNKRKKKLTAPWCPCSIFPG